MSKQLSARLTENNTKKLTALYEFLNQNSFAYDQDVSTKNRLLNELLNDYLSFLIDKWQENGKLQYSEIKKQMVKTSNKNLKNLYDLERKQFDRMNMILYLLMDVDKSIIRKNMQSYTELNSMHKVGTKEAEMFSKLLELVDEDNENLFKKIKQKGKNTL